MNHYFRPYGYANLPPAYNSGVTGVHAAKCGRGEGAIKIVGSPDFGNS